MTSSAFREAAPKSSFPRGGNLQVLSIIIALIAALGTGQLFAQVAEPDYQTICSDCTGTSYFQVGTTAATTNGCQDYSQFNRYENWSAGDNATAAAQTDIRFVRQASDATFWYYQTEVRATTWGAAPEMNAAHVEMAFGDCSLSTTRFRLLLTYAAAAEDIGSDWNEQGDGKIKFFQDTNSDVGGTNNDGPATPTGTTSDFNCGSCNGYDADVSVDSDDAYARLRVVDGRAVIEFAIRRASLAALLSGIDVFSPCGSRVWTMQTSTLDKSSDFAWNDKHPSSDLSSSSWAMDNCGVGCDVTTANAGSDTEGCATGPIAISANAPGAGETGMWSIVSGGTGTFDDATANMTTFTPDAPGVYTLRWTITEGECTSSDEVEVTASAPPTTADAGEDQSVCDVTTATLDGNTPTVGTGMWTVESGGATVTDPSSPTSGVTGLTAGENTFRWTIANGSCPASFDEVVITRFLTVVSDAGPDQSACGLGAITLAGNDPSPGTGLWTIQSGPGSGSFSDDTSPTSTFTPDTAGTYVLRWRITNGACISDDTMEATFSDEATANAGPNQSVCGLAPVQLAANDPSPGTGEWTVASGPGGTFSDDTSNTSTYTPSAAGTHTLTWTVTNNGCVVSDSVVITVSTLVVSNAGPDQTACGLGPITLAGNNPSPGTGLWTIQSGPGGGSFSDATSPTSTFTANTTGTYVLRWRITNGACVSDDTMEAEFSSDTVANAGPDQSVCGLGAVQLAANDPSPGTGLWTVASGPGGAFSDDTSNTSTYTPSAAGTHTLTWTVTSGDCVVADNVVITVSATVTANAGPDQAVCSLDPVQLAANDPSPGTGAWSIISGPGGTFSNDTSPTATFTPSAAGSYTLQWTVTNGACNASDTVGIVVSGEVIADAGPDQSHPAPTTVTLAGNTPSSGMGLWTIVSGGTGMFSDATSPTSMFTPDDAGTYVLRWTVTDGGCSAFDEMQIRFGTGERAEPIPTASDWALLVMLLALVVAGTRVIASRA